MGLEIISLVLLLSLSSAISQSTKTYCPGAEKCDYSLTPSQIHSSELLLVSQKVSQLFSMIQGLQEKQTDLEEEVKDLKDENTDLKEQIDLLNKTGFGGQGLMSKPENCADIYDSGHTESGVYTVFVASQSSTNLRKVSVYCDMETTIGGWTVFQKRFDGSISFDRPWFNYRYGFGNLSTEFWMGNDILSDMILSHRHYRLRVDLTSFDNEKRYAEYENFLVSGATDKYRLNIGSYSGNAGDNLEGLSYHNNMQFSTKDNDNDESSNNCAQLRGGGFWFKKCDMVNTNAKYRYSATTGADTIQWEAWLGTRALKATEMKFRPM